MKAVLHKRNHPYSVVSWIDMTSNNYSLVLHETVCQLSHPHKIEGHTLERSKVPLELTR